MKTCAIIQARMGSQRLPGKVLKSIIDKTVLEHVILRLQRAQGIDEVIVATTIQPQDDQLAEQMKKLNILCYRGSELDVLARYYDAAQFFGADVIIRITSDCPLLDPELISKMIASFDSTIDYLSNCLERHYPRGLDVEIFSIHALTKAYHSATKNYEREHVTPYIYQHPQDFVLKNFPNKENLGHHRWTLDTPEDFEFISSVYDSLYTSKPHFVTKDILQLLAQKPHLANINKHISQKEIVNARTQ